ncbi:hypothetical protein DH2020_025724 [Rehmannia glutinosa]|uniref:Structural maintenance of chromosomes protein 5 n=1 Tax=Rehmannia glutinosa TaxID=99300 RepID=A0ABR0VZ29_REHGL
MTFNKLTCKPGSRLNLVIGPNGSGKSSLVCAIALGLGGEPQHRAVEYGEESQSACFISLSALYDFCTSCLGFWYTSVHLKRLKKAVGDPQLPVQHRTLIMKSQELKKFERAVASNKGSLDQLKAHNAELEKDVKRVRQREDLLAKAESMKKKLPWLKYDIKKAEYLEAKKQEEDAKLKLDDAAKALKELREPIEKQKGEKAKQEAKLKKLNGLLDSNMKKRSSSSGTYNEVDDLRRHEESRQQRISKAKEDLAAAEAELANLPPYEPPKHKMEQLSAQIMELEESAKEMRYQKREKETHLNRNKVTLTQCIDRLREMENANNKRLQALKNSGAEKIFEAYQWVQEHRSQFNKEVYGPVLLEMRKFGISSRLDQVFEAPHAVKEVLIGQFGLDNSEIESVKSRKVELEEKISTIDANLRALQTALRRKEDEAAELQREREEIVNITQSKKKKWREMEHLVNQRRIKLKSIEREDDPDAAIAKLTDKVKELKIQRFQCVIDIKNLLTEAVAYRRSFAENNLCSIELEAKIKEMESDAKQQEKVAVQASLYLDHRKNAMENCRQQLSVAKKHAESVAVITPELKQAFLEMPATVEDLEAAIQDTISQANSILFLNHNILEEYESRQRKIEELTNKQEMDEKELNDLLDEINALKVFLAHPKIAANLEYSDACSILTVMNGPWIEQPSKGVPLSSLG